MLIYFFQFSSADTSSDESSDSDDPESEGLVRSGGGNLHSESKGKRKINLAWMRLRR